MTKITVSGCSSGRDDRNTLRKLRHFQFLVQGQYSFFLQLQQYFPATTGHISQCIGRINIEHGQTVTVKFVKLDGHFHQHFNAGCKRLPGRFLEIGFQQTINGIPNHTACFSNKTIAARIFLHKFQIAMACRIGTDIAQLSLYPIFIRQALLQTTADKRIQLQKRKSFSTLPRREGG